ncbi:MAG: PQQ-binding-like beta-propeller repeat protein [Pirellulaceae bacterium]|nr:PQQ-binding-like beta-propeller repeat protein [Pirellulaceae bacterium]
MFAFSRKAFLVLLVSAPFVASVLAETNWSRWRGPNENGHSLDTKLPVKWSDKDVVWKVDLPGSGQSSPVIWGDQIFLTAALEDGKERVVFCLSRKSGKLIWQHSAWKGEPEPVHKMNGWASATCVTDGDVVVAFFGRGGIHAYTLDGKPLWSKNLGTFESPWGVAACPIIVDDMVIQNCDADVDAYITALDKKTGNEIWKTKRQDHRGWSTPILVDTGTRRELVINGHEGVQAYDPKTGKDLWFCKGFNGRGEPTVTPAGKLLCVVNGLAGDFYSVRPGGNGDVTSSHMAWHTPRKGGRDCPSPIVVGKYITVCDMKGIATCYDAEDGHIFWKERLPGNFSASPITANGLVYFISEEGITSVIKPGPTFEVISENALKAGTLEIFRASITPSEGQLFIRSTTVLYCVGNKS